MLENLPQQNAEGYIDPLILELTGRVSQTSTLLPEMVEDQNTSGTKGRSEMGCLASTWNIDTMVDGFTGTKWENANLQTIERNQALQVMADLAMQQIGLDLSGAGQGSAPKPPPKIQGGQNRAREEKRYIPVPQKQKTTPPPSPKPKNPWLPKIKLPFITPKKPEGGGND